MFTQNYAKNYLLNKVNYSGHRNSINIVEELINPCLTNFLKFLEKCYVHNIFTTNFKCQVVISCYK